MTPNQQKKAAKEFAARWENKGDEKQDSQRFWIDLLQNVYEIEEPTNFVRFEQRVKLEHTSYIDVMIPATHTMIEQKSLGKDLNAPIKQSDGTLLTPGQQAMRYAAALPYSDRPRWIISCNFAEFQIYDMEHPNNEPQKLKLKDLGEEYYRLQFMVDVANSHITKEMDISRDAGALVGKIYNALLPAYGEAPSDKDLQDLNKLIVRLVFCMYAEDAGIFGRRDMFHDFLTMTSVSDVRRALMDLFKVLDQKPEERDRFLEKKYADFPYVNGSLFSEDIPIPPIDEDTLKLIEGEGCDFNWAEISPTIFGAIFESTLNPDTRREGGMHYTSIENIHKVIDPLFLDDYRLKFQEAMGEKTLKKRIARLKMLQKELASAQFFDPAAGSGNFLTESYLSLRRLENDILRETITDDAGTGVLGFTEEEFNPVMVNIGQFYGIEINDFAVAVAKTALWIAESQMLCETEDIIRREIDFLPLKTNANIHEGNALRIDWKDVLDPQKCSYIMGNPPFSAGRRMGDKQREDMNIIAAEFPKNGELDYVCAWYIVAAKYMENTKIKASFVSTSSITQGEQVILLWKKLFEEYKLQIVYAVRPFKWTSESHIQAGVHCVIIEFCIGETNKKKYIESDGIKKEVSHINGYLTEAKNVWIEGRRTPICNVPLIANGNKPLDNAICAFDPQEKDEFIKKEPGSAPYFFRYMGSREFINNIERWFLLINRMEPALVRKMPLVMEKLEEIREYRLQSKSKQTKNLADTPAKFHFENMPEKDFLVIPQTSSGRRRYVPIGFLTPDIIVNNKLQVMRDGGLYEFGILSSNVHNVWLRTVAGRIRADFTYSVSVVYNTFPWPNPTEKQKKEIEKTAQQILDARKKNANSCLADLYDPVGMTLASELLEAHRANDKAVMKAYGFWGKFNSESECIAELMKMYEELTHKEEMR